MADANSGNGLPRIVAVGLCSTASWLNRLWVQRRWALANERVQTNAAGQVGLKLTTRWRDGAAQLFILPLDSCSVCADAKAMAAPDPFGVRLTAPSAVSSAPLRESLEAVPQAGPRPPG